MRIPLVDVRPPGIYSEVQEKKHTPITLGKSGVVGFVGLAERGPTNQPVRITGIPQFYEIFGDLPEGGFLKYCVEAFFKNGGKECYVVRVAHLTGRDVSGYARCASVKLLDFNGNSTIEIMASSEGRWGNNIRISAGPQPPKSQTFITLDLEEGQSWATVRSTHGIREGALIKIYNDEAEFYRTVLAISGKNIEWDEQEPIPRKMLASAPTYVEPVEFEIKASCSFFKETFSDLSFFPGSPSFVERVVSERSRLIKVKVLPSPSPPPNNLPKPVENISLSGGKDGLNAVSPDDFIGMSEIGLRTGISAYETVEDVDLIAIPDIMWLYQKNKGKESAHFSTLKDVEVVHEAMISHCEAMNDRFAILDSPFPDDIERTRDYRMTFDTKFGALYFPWIYMDRKGGRILVPPCGHIAGIIARSDHNMGVHKPPANEVLEDAADLAIVLREEDIGALNAGGINCIKSFSNMRGLRIWGARTMSSDPQSRFINVRRTLNAIIKAINTNLQWVVFEPNLPSLWKKVTRNITDFLMHLFRAGYFSGETPEEAFFVKCDEETNPPEERDAGRLIVEVGVAPVRPSEFIVVRLAQEMHSGIEGE